MNGDGRRLGSRTLGRASAALVILLTLVGCGAERGEELRPADTAPSAAREVEVGATSPLVRWLVERLGGEGVRVSALPAAGVDPRAWSPTAEEVLALSAADLIVLHGAGYEPWRDQIDLPVSRTLDTTADLDLIETGTTTHSHGREGEHSHAVLDAATWHDPRIVAAQAERIAEALSAVDPAHAADREQRLAELQQACAELAERSASVGDRLEGAGVVVLAERGRFRYLVRSLGVAAAELAAEDPELEHTAAATRGRRVLLVWSEDPPPALLAALRREAADLRLVVLGDLSVVGAEREWDEGYAQNLAALERAASEP